MSIKMSYRDKYLRILKLYPDIERNTNAWIVENGEVDRSSDTNIASKDLIFLALEVWKIEKKIKKIKEKNGNEIVQGIEYPINKIYEILDKNAIKIIDYTWKKYIEWMNWVDIVSVEKNESVLETIILDTISPIIEINWIISERSKVVVLTN